MTQSASVIINPKTNRSRHRKPHLVCYGESYSGRFGNRLRESQSTKLGISGLHVLVVEDEALLALDIIGMLEDAGATVSDPVSTCEAALNSVKTRSFGAVLLDGNLGGQSVGPVATELTKKGIPFVFVTGYGRESLPKDFEQTPIIGKPFSPAQLVDAVCSLVRSSAN